jgi:hypothetical protein
MAKVGEGPAAQRYGKMKAVDRAKTAQTRAHTAAKGAQAAADKAKKASPKKGLLSSLISKRKKALDSI